MRNFIQAGKTSYPDLSSIPEKVEVANIFLRSERVMPVVEEAIKIGAKAVWMQEGIINEEAAACPARTNWLWPASRVVM